MENNNIKLKKIIYTGLMIAVVFVLTRFTTISFAFGYFNVGDIAIMLTSFLLGPFSGFLAGSIGSALADLSSGYIIFIPVTFIVKGFEGFVFGMLLKNANNTKRKVKALFLGFGVMVVGYFLSEAFILGFFDPYFGIAAAFSDLLNNLIQATISGIIGYILIRNDKLKEIVK